MIYQSKLDLLTLGHGRALAPVHVRVRDLVEREVLLMPLLQNRRSAPAG